MLRKIGLVTILTVIFNTSIYAQKFELALFAGGASYKGDLNQANYFDFTDPSFGASFRFNMNPRNSIKISFITGTVRANDADSKHPDQIKRNLAFFSRVNEFSAQFEFNFFKYNPFVWGERFSPYVFTGISGFLFNPQALDGTYLRPIGTEGQHVNGSLHDRTGISPPGFSLSIPIGLGAKVNIKRQWGFFAEMGYRTAFTDYLDDVSGYYADLSSSPDSQKYADRSPLLGYLPNEPGTQRGDLNKKDGYLFAVIGITFTFVSSPCIAFR